MLTMSENKTSNAQIKASRNWEKKNPEKAKAGWYRRTARAFLDQNLSILNICCTFDMDF